MTNIPQKRLGEITLEDLDIFYSKYHQPRCEYEKKEEKLGEQILRFLECDRDNVYVENRVYGNFFLADLSDGVKDFLKTCKAEPKIMGINFKYSDRTVASFFDGSAEETPLSFHRVITGFNEEKSAMSNALIFVSRPELNDKLVLAVIVGSDLFERKQLSLLCICRKDEYARTRATHVFESINTGIRTNSCYKGKVIEPLTDYGKINGFEFVDFLKVNREHIIFDEATWDSIDRNLLQFFVQRDVFKHNKIPLKRGILLAGDPGTGKTLLCQYLVGYFSGYTTLYVSTVETRAISGIVSMAKYLQPSIIVLEDIDLVAGARDKNQAKAVLGELMNQMEGFSTADDIIFLCTTNHLQGIEPAIIVRPGRIDHIIELPCPNDALREKLITLYTEGILLEAKKDLWIKKTRGFAPATIKELVKKAASTALLRGKKKQGRIVVTDMELEVAYRDLASQLKKVERTHEKKKSARKRSKK